MNEGKILVVDDDLRLRTLLLRYLTEQGFVTQAVGDAVQMDRLLRREVFDLLVLDLMLPGEDGLSICRRLRGQGSALPILMLTARGDEVDRIVGLEIGADDYLPKPFNPRELLARIRAVLRRRTPGAPGAPALADGPVRFGPNVLDPQTRELTHDGERRALTSGEFAVLRALVAHPRVPLARDKLIALARGREPGSGERSIDVHISRIRKLVETDPLRPRYVQTVWGVGYCFVPDGERAGSGDGEPGDAA